MKRQPAKYKLSRWQLAVLLWMTLDPNRAFIDIRHGRYELCGIGGIRRIPTQTFDTLKTNGLVETEFDNVLERRTWRITRVGRIAVHSNLRYAL